MNIAWKDNRLYFEGEFIEPNGGIRKVRDMWECVLDKQAMEGNEDLGLYYMHRDVAYDKDRKMLEEHRLRYDIVVLIPTMLGREYNKTAGHYHEKASPDLTYGEMYEVLEGEGIFFVQKDDDAFFAKAKKGDQVIVPPNCAHITINTEKEPLIAANWMARKVASDYEPIKEKQGGMYFLTKDGWIENKNYENIPKLREQKPDNITKDPIYYAFFEEPEKFKFLVDPALYKHLP